MCTHCQVAEWLIQFRPILNRHGVDVDHHSMWLTANPAGLPRIKWPGHPDDGMWREYNDGRGNVIEVGIPISKVTSGVPYSIDVDENVSPAQLVFQYHADEVPENGNVPYTFGVITICLADLSVRYYRQRCGVATESDAAGLPDSMKMT